MQHETLATDPTPAAGEATSWPGAAWAFRGASLRILARDPARLRPVPADLARALHPSEVLLYEWTEYWLDAPDADAVRIGAEWAAPVPGGLFTYQWQNRVGLAELQPCRNGRPVGKPLFAEVLSAKVPEPAEHEAFLGALLDDLVAYVARLPLDITGSTGRGVTESAQPPSPLFALHFLVHSGDALNQAVQAIQARPHRRLRDTPEQVPFALASEVDADVLLDIARHPERWRRAPAVTVSQRLGGYAPAEVWQRRPEETADTPENRFARAFLRDLLVAAEDLQTRPLWARVPAERRGAVRHAARVAATGLHHSMFDGVGEMKRFPASSRLLMRRDGYRELLALWRLFQRARRPLFAPLQAAIDLRDVASLYEVWTFFKLAEEIGRLLALPRLRLIVGEAGGLAWNAAADFGAHGRLLYNAMRPSYSTPLRPDCLWQGPDGDEVALDAKFRLGTESPLLPGADGRLDEQRYPAIGTMHHYRDALGLRAAAVVFPGATSCFYAIDGDRHLPFSLADLLLQRPAGVGAIALSPIAPNPPAAAESAAPDGDTIHD
jgi:hypothetical protein